MQIHEPDFLSDVCDDVLTRALITIAEQGLRHEAALLALAIGTVTVMHRTTNIEE